MSQLQLLTKENWQEYEEGASTYAMYGYMDATGHFIPELKRILKCQSFSEMKDQLTKLCNDREEFVEQVANNWQPTKNPKY